MASAAAAARPHKRPRASVAASPLGDPPATGQQPSHYLRLLRVIDDLDEIYADEDSSAAATARAERAVALAADLQEQLQQSQGQEIEAQRESDQQLAQLQSVAVGSEHEF